MKLKLLTTICSLSLLFCSSCAEKTISLYQGKPEGMAKIVFGDPHNYSLLHRFLYTTNTPKFIYNIKIDEQLIDADKVEIAPGTHEIEGEVYGYYIYNYSCTAEGTRYKLVMNLKPGFQYNIWGTRAQNQAPTIAVAKSSFNNPSLIEEITDEEYQSIPAGKIGSRCAN
jgi:hypothetical protein